MNKIPFILLSVITLFGFRSEDTPLLKMLQHLAKITADYPQEKVHLHIDKPYYATGDDIWIKGYVVTAEKNEPSLVSGVLHVELIDAQQVVKKKIKLETIGGIANGQLSLDTNLNAGIYRIRAYTNYMRNFNSDFFFYREVIIGNPAMPPTADSKTIKPPPSLQFFPESGHLLAGIKGKVGVKAIDASGRGINLSGYIENATKQRVAEFKTEFAGMGAFLLRPLANENYTAVVKLSEGQTKTFALPPVKESGYALALTQTKDSVVFKIMGTETHTEDKELSVLAQANGIPYALYDLKLGKGEARAAIANNKFPTGIIQFTLFDNITPLAERLIFVNHHDEMKIAVAHDGAKPGKKSDFSFQVSDFADNPVDGHFSVAVVDLGKVPHDQDDETSIFASLLLNSDLKGNIEKPNYYFNQINPEKERHLDQLLLTQGWRRFVWDDLKNEKKPLISHNAEQGISIAGTVLNKTDQPLKNIQVNLLISAPGRFMKLDTLTDAGGNFVFDRLDIPDSVTLTLQANVGKDVEAKIVLNEQKVSAYSSTLSAIDLKAFIENAKKTQQEYRRTNASRNAVQLETVDIKSDPNLKPKINVKNSANINGAADYVITRETLQHETNIITPFMRVPGIKLKYKNKNAVIYGLRRISLTSDTPMALIVDGVYIDQLMMPDYLSSINPRDVEGIEVLTHGSKTSILGTNAPTGAIYITTRKGDDLEPVSTRIAAMLRLRNVGITARKEFYAPDYDDPTTNRALYNLRSTIYWNPNITTSMNGTGKFSFFNTANPGTYQLTIEGIDIFGNLGRKVYQYTVKNE